jgi:hypothetical protein
MIWPRGFVGAAAFWNYNASVSPSDPAFVSSIWSLNNLLASRGSLVCPTNCSCDQLTACGVPYIQPEPQDAWQAVTGGCTVPFNNTELWVLNTAGNLQLRSNSSLCLHDPGVGIYPLTLGACDGSAATWTHPAATSEFIQTATGACMDRRASDGLVGTYACGSGMGLQQLNQEWAYDAVSGVILSFETPGSGCLTVTPA